VELALDRPVVAPDAARRLDVREEQDVHDGPAAEVVGWAEVDEDVGALVGQPGVGGDGDGPVGHVDIEPEFGKVEPLALAGKVQLADSRGHGRQEGRQTEPVEDLLNIVGPVPCVPLGAGLADVGDEHHERREHLDCCQRDGHPEQKVLSGYPHHVVDACDHRQGGDDSIDSHARVLTTMLTALGHTSRSCNVGVGCIIMS
jgi:hypothetical protein